MDRALLALALLGPACLVTNPHYADTESTSDTNAGAGATSATGAGGESSAAGTMGVTGGAGLCASDDTCNDGLFCNGAEACAPEAPGADDAGCAPGAPPCGDGMTCDEDADLCLDACQVDPDADDDGVPAIACGGADCDDTDPEVRPGAAEICDPAGVDEDCDPSTLANADQDADGLAGFACCNLVMGELECGLDCDDTKPGFGVGDWAHCGACGHPCGVQQACVAGACAAARRVFATSNVFNADLGGLPGADARCQQHADAAGLGGTFRAYLVSSGQGISRVMQPGPFVRLDGVVLADDWGAFSYSKGSIQAPFHVAETRATIGGNAWTGLGEDLNYHCNDWTTASFGCLQGGPCGVAGETPQTDTRWNGNSVYHCSDLYRLYCVEQ